MMYAILDLKETGSVVPIMNAELFINSFFESHQAKGVKIFKSDSVNYFKRNLCCLSGWDTFTDKFQTLSTVFPQNLATRRWEWLDVLVNPALMMYSDL